MATAFPPIHTHSSTRVSTAHAQHLLSIYLNQSISTPSLQPNALLTESGASDPSGTHTGLIIHNLQRIEAGLRGENLGADLEIGKGKEKKEEEKEKGLEEIVLMDETTGEADAVVVGGPSTGKVPGGEDVELGEGEWQDRSEFERDQEDLEGETGDRDGKDGGDGVPRVGRGNKVERKKKKEERRKREKREREEERRERKKKREAGTD